MRTKSIRLPVLMLTLLLALAPMVFAAPQDRATTLGILNQPPAFVSGPSDNGSSGTAPTNVGVDVSFSATASDPNDDNYYVAVCKTAAVTPGAGSAPTCDGGSWGNVTASTVSGVAITPIAYTTLVGDAESNAWYAFACDGNGAGGSGDPDHQCSAVSNSESPFNVNHVPTFGTLLVGSAAGGTGNIVPGSTVYFHLNANGGANGIDDNDADTAQDTVRVYICDSATTGMSVPGTCAGGTSICSQSTPFDPNTTPFECSNGSIAAIPTAHNSYNFKVFVFDSHNFAGTGTTTQTYAVQDVAPVVDTYSVQDIHPTAGGSVVTSFTVLVSDNNGWDDIDTVDGLIYDSASGGGGTALSSGTCAANEKNCYLRAACSKAQNTSTQITATCDSITTWFNINPTSPGVWKAHANAVDTGHTTVGADSSTDIAVGALSAVAVTQTGIAYGGIAVGGTSSSSQPTTLQNVGNILIDVGIHGTDMLDGSNSIPLAQQRWATDTGFSYLTGDHPLVADPETVPGNADQGCANRSVAVRASHASTATDSDIFWKLRIPNPQATGSYAGTNTFTSIVDGLCTGTDGGGGGGDICGNSLITGAETCDDGNTTPGDGCSVVCVTETNYLCSGTPSTCHPTVQIGTQNWFAKNLNVGTMIVGDVPMANDSAMEKYCYDNSEANCTIYGGLYQWDEAMGYGGIEGAQGICPAGSHIPSVFDWETLVTYLGGASVAGGALKEVGTAHWTDPNVGATNSSGFTGLSSGWNDMMSFGYLGQYEAPWTSKPSGGTDALGYYFYNTGIDIATTAWPRSYGLPVRCLQNPTPACGNNFIDAGETCDDGNDTPADGCSAVCAIEPGYSCVGLPSVCDICGNGVVGISETCDDNNIIPGDGCSAVCAIESGYSCSGAPSTCAPVCGDGVITSPETCDDGNTNGYDGCSDVCATEADALCTGEPSVCAFTTFRVTTDLSNNWDTARSVAVQSDGKIVVAGDASVGGGKFALARYNTNGTLDTTFGSNLNGKVIETIGDGNSTAYSVAIQSDGKIVGVGDSYNSSTNKFYFTVVRYNTNGTLDDTFDGDASMPNSSGNGIVTTAIENDGSMAFAVAIQSDGKIVVAGQSSNTTTYYNNFAVARYTSTGALDTNFSGDGKVYVDINSSANDYATSVAIQPNGGIVAAGTVYTNLTTRYDIALIRFTTSGTPDSGFGTGGIVITDFDGQNDTGTSVATQSDNNIVVAANVSTSSYHDTFSLARYNGGTGALDGGFGTGGKVTTSIANNNWEYANAVTIDANGKIVAAGTTYSPVTNYYDFALVRYNTDGTPDVTFGPNSTGIVTMNNGGIDYLTTSVAIYSPATGANAGKIAVAGTARFGASGDFALLRFTTAGALDAR